MVIIVYLDEAWENPKERSSRPTSSDLYEAVMYGAVQRVRPKMMTVTAIIAGLLPIMWSHGAGADTMKRIAAPMVGGMVSSTILTLLIIPAIYFAWRSREIQMTKAVTEAQIRGAAVDLKGTSPTRLAAHETAQHSTSAHSCSARSYAVCR